MLFLFLSLLLICEVCYSVFRVFSCSVASICYYSCFLFAGTCWFMLQLYMVFLVSFLLCCSGALEIVVENDTCYFVVFVFVVAVCVFVIVVLAIAVIVAGCINTVEIVRCSYSNSLKSIRVFFWVQPTSHNQPESSVEAMSKYQTASKDQFLKKM